MALPNPPPDTHADSDGNETNEDDGNSLKRRKHEPYSILLDDTASSVADAQFIPASLSMSNTRS